MASRFPTHDYDSDNRITGVRLNGTLRYEYAYDANSELSYVKDVRDGSIVWTVQDLAGRLSEVLSSDGSVARYTYNSASQFTKLTEILSGNTLTTE